MKMGETLPLTRRRNRREVKMRAGASVQPLRFPEGFFPTEGFTRQLDGLHARVLVIEGPARHAILVLELTSLPPEEVEGLILLGAYIYGDYPDEKTLTVYGSLNQSVEDHIDYTENIVEIEGGNHAQFGNYGPQKGDLPAAISAEEQQEQTVAAIEEFLARAG